jgi:hypothetical protein
MNETRADKLRMRIEQACKERTTLASALADIAIWECERAMLQKSVNEASGALCPNGQRYETCFGYLFDLVLQEWARQHKLS